MNFVDIFFKISYFVLGSIAHLSTSDRNNWASARQHLISLGDNKSKLEAIDSAIFCLVLDDQVDTEPTEKSVETFLHGDARWFDKSFSLIVAANGDTALNFEHAWGDGVAVVRFFSDIFSDSTENPTLTDIGEKNDLINSNLVTPLSFETDKELKNIISISKHDYDTSRGSLAAAGGFTEKLNKKFLKNKKVSPDGVMQLAIQVGHMYVYNHPAPTYESCSTSAFKHGRTETVRSCSVESMAAAKLLLISKLQNKLTDNEVKLQCREAINTSCNKHNQLTKEAAMGLGFDRHLFALKQASLEISNEIPAFFNSKTYNLMNSIVLSTSTLNCDALQFGGFAPVTPKGFGIGYGIRDEGVGVNITAYDDTKAQQLCDAIVEAYDDIYNIFDSK